MQFVIVFFFNENISHYMFRCTLYVSKINVKKIEITKPKNTTK